MGVRARIELFRRIPIGTTLTLVMPPEGPAWNLGELEGTVGEHITGRFLGLEDVTLACPKVRLATLSTHGNPAHRVVTLEEILRVKIDQHSLTSSATG